MKRSHILLVAGLSIAGCAGPSERAEPAVTSEARLPVVRYYVIGDA